MLQAERSQAGTAAMGRSVSAGLLGGAGATLAMSLVLLFAQKVGLIGEIPPRKITRKALRHFGIGRTSPTEEKILAVATHWAFGMGAGAVFGFLRRRRTGVGRAAALGVAFGTTVWAASYAGWVPALGIMPPPHRDRRLRPSVMIAAHIVFGSILGALVEKLSPASASSSTGS